MNCFKQISFGDLKKRTEEALCGSVIISLDINWAGNFVLENALQLASECGIKPTLFLIHESPLIEKIFIEKKYEFSVRKIFSNIGKMINR